MLLEDEYTTDKYAQCIAKSKRVSWDIDSDVIKGREFDFSQNFLPDSMSRVQELTFLNEEEKRFISQIQGRTYACMFGMVERFINAKILESSQDHWFGDQVALEALVRFSEEEIKHQELFRRINSLISIGMPQGYKFFPDGNEVAKAILKKSTWSVLALICLIEVFTLAHYRQSIHTDPNLSPLYKDIFRFHWLEEAQHVAIDELEWIRENKKLTRSEREHAVDDFIDLADMVYNVISKQADYDTDFFARTRETPTSDDELKAIFNTIKSAYVWQYMLSGIEHPRFLNLLTSMITPEQGERLMKVVNTLK